MMRNVTKAFLVALIIAAGGFAVAGTAEASHVVAEISAPDQVAVGQPAIIEATLLSEDDGQPVANAAVMVYTDASFAGVEGEVALGTAVTDENGIATLTFEPRSASEHELRFEYTTSNDSEPEVFSKTINVTEGNQQLHQSASGIQVPGLNVWLIIAVVATVWFLLFSVGVRVFVIARGVVEPEGVAS